MDGEASGRDELDLLADLQAGLLDDRSAARLRHRARADPEIARQLAVLDRVRRDVTHLGTDATSAPDVPADVTARIGAALRSQARRSSFRRGAAIAGMAAVLAAGVIGTAMLVRHAPAAESTPATRTADEVPLSDDQIVALVSQPPDLGDLADPQRRASCLGGLGYPTSTAVLGGRAVQVNGRLGVLMLLPADTPGRLDAVVVAPNCSSVDTGLLARRVVDHP